MSPSRNAHCVREERRARARQFARSGSPARDIDSVELAMRELGERHGDLAAVVAGLMRRVERLEGRKR